MCVVRLDETQTKANLAVFTKNLDELYARQARLEAEKDGASPSTFLTICWHGRATDPEVAHILEGRAQALQPSGGSAQRAEGATA